MFAAYSYFRAEGASLTAIETVAEARDELEQMRKKLATHFGADKVTGSISRDTGRFTIDSFVFEPPKKMPQGWEQAEVYGAPAGKYGLPKPGSSEHFYMLNMAGLMERAAKRTDLEAVLKSGEMPWRDMQDGQHLSGQFVRYAAAREDTAKPSGQLSDPFAHGISMSGGPWKASDSLSYAKLDGGFYIRVPNRPGTETPAYTPPDAKPVSYDDMLSLDRREQQLRYDKLRGSTFEGYA